MNDFRLSLSLLACFALNGCAKTNSPGNVTNEDFRPIVEKEIEAAIRGYFGGFTTSTCENVSPVSKFIRDDMIFVTEKDIFTIPIEDYEHGLRERICSWARHTGVINSIKVDVLGRDVGVEAWLYDDTVFLKSGETSRTKGSVLMTLVRDGEGWKITSAMQIAD